ncbi:Uncharacterised protein [Legionella lansingensis]|uniref:Uncharacterized protein n=1 Tax=Legionella lansingensis TaxID=45067 RepID=A0A0W0VY13_9GAMM|nr:hypothetical protein [Legionella lansingensis]KTD24943.1 hypothetical protein Llan_0297 [Legionella lansingensis]SNV50249.1 Uncharacterised protein [Legionella lansingensis]
MKGALKLVLGGIWLAATASGFATTTTTPSATDLSKNWTCTTNASSSSVASEQEADKKMSETKASANDAFALATANCRDCTKITCEVDD